MPAPSFHTRGAAKLYSSACFAAIGGLEAGLGWDTIDEVRAMMLGFSTRNFRHIRAYHHRPQGTDGGLWQGRKAAGRAAYNVGYSPVFLMARAVDDAETDRRLDFYLDLDAELIRAGSPMPILH